MRFYSLAERHKDSFLTGQSKTVKTEAGQFSWVNNPEGLIYRKEDEPKVIAELVKLGRLDLLRMEVKKTETSAVLKSGQIRLKHARVGVRERFVITPKGELSVTVCGDDPVRIGKEELPE